MKSSSAKLWVALSFLIPCGIVQAGVLHFRATLSGANEIPAVNSTGTGTADVYFDTDAHTLQVNIVWSGLTGTTTASHLHAPSSASQITTAVPFNGTWGVATQSGTFTSFPTGVTSGSYVGAAYSLLSTSNFTTTYVAANGGTAASSEAALLAYMLAGKSYLNVHSSFAAGGEIKGYLQFVAESGSTARLINVSSRAQVGSGDSVLIAGFVVGGTSPRTVLIRAVGPTLTGFGVSGALTDPQVDLVQTANNANVIVASNDDWGGIAQISAAAASVGAFPLAGATSKDAAVLVTLRPGVYTARASGVGGTSGNVLIEVYEIP